METTDFNTESFSLKMKSCKNYAIFSSALLVAGIFSAFFFPQYITLLFSVITIAFAAQLVVLFFKIKSAESAFQKPFAEFHRRDLRFTTLIENAPFIVMQFNLDGSLIYSNLKNKFPECVTLHSVFEFLTGESKERLNRDIALIAERKLPKITSDIRWVFSPNVSRFHSTVLAPVVERGGVASIIAMITDVTDNEQLHEQLLRIQKLEAVSILAAGIAHDFNNSMSLISLHSERALRATSADSPVYDSVKKIQKAVIQAAALTRKLLTLSKDCNDEVVPISLNEVINDFQHMLCKVVDRDIQFEVKLDDSLPMIESNEVLLEQIITNLVVNARDAIREKKYAANGKHITIETKTFSRGGNSPSLIFLSVADTGIGMKEDVLQKIFDPFFTTKGSDRGTGLGLTMVSALVKKLNGTIAVDSAHGVGTTFTIGFPVCLKVKFDDSEIKNLRRGKTIAVVEDSPDTLSIVTKYLQASGFSVVPFQSEGALREWLDSGRNSFDLVITDFYLTDSDGKAVIENLREHEPKIPVILTSGYPLEQLDIQIEHYGNIDYLQKPFSARQVAEKVQTFFTE